MVPQVRKRNLMHRMRSITFMFMLRDPSLKLLPLVHKVVVVDKKAISSLRRGPPPLVQQQKG
jgi:hypothetical protein